MHRLSLPLIAVCLGGLTTLTQAQTAPPIKPGLWEVAMERDGAAQKMPDMSERLKNMSPEQRKQMEAMMKQHGVDLSGGPGKLRICLNKDSLDQGRWQGRGEADTRCKTDVTDRSSTAWRWHSVCTDPQSETTGEALFATPESYTVKSTTTTTLQGQAKTTQMIIRSKWLGGDCGDVKPVQPMQHLRPKTKMPAAG
jgi:hypothetical protein